MNLTHEHELDAPAGFRLLELGGRPSDRERALRAEARAAWPATWKRLEQAGLR